jgi:signal transduction histidine kinase
VLHDFITANRHEIITRCKAKVSARSIPSVPDAASAHGVTVFLDQLSGALRRRSLSSVDIASSAVQHGHELLRQGFTVSQVVYSYGDVCQALTELALEANAPIGTDDFRMLNLCLDDAIAGAVTAFSREQNQSTLDGEIARGNERAGFVAHEVRNLLNTAVIAFDVLKTGQVGVGGSMGTVLHRSLMGARDFLNRSLAEVRLTDGARNPLAFSVAEFIEELALAATMEGRARGVRLRVVPVADGLVVEADRQVLRAVVMNLLQNAFKFTRAGTTVVLSVTAGADRVLIEIEDECGGLPTGDVNELFRPFEQRGADRTGVGLGLAFSRLGVEANNGRIYARDLPNKGCVFGIDLPRLLLPAFAIA